MVFQNNILSGVGGQGAAAGITVDESCLFNPGDSPRLYRTPTVAGNRMVGSLSLWYKRSGLTTILQLFNAGAGDDITFNASDKLTFIDSSGVSYITTQVFRDTTAWGHLLFAWDTTLAAAGDRLRIYHNGVEITAFATETNPDQYDELEISNTVRQTIGANESNTEEFDGYLSQVYLVDGAQLTPTSFGEFNTNNVWRPIEYAGGDTVISWIDASGETLIGNMTQYAGLSSCFDGDATKGYLNSAGNGVDDFGTCGVDWGVGNTKTITQVITVGTSDYGYSSPGRTINIKFEGSTDNFVSSTVDLGGGTGDFSDVTADSFKIITPTDTTAYRYHRVYITSSVGARLLTQLFLYEEETGYGENGFKLDFADSADLGNDVSGNNNDYTSSGLTTYDQVTDTPTNNFPTIMRNTSIAAMSEGNLKVDNISSVTWHIIPSTLRIPSTGKWCFQITAQTNLVVQIGYMGDTQLFKGKWGLNYAGLMQSNYTSYYLGYSETGSNIDGSSTTVSATALASGDLLQVLLDQDAGTITYYKDGVLQKEWTGVNTMAYVYYQLYGDSYGTPHILADYGQHGFTRVDTDYNYICTNNFPEPTILDGTANFQTTLYTGNATDRNISQTENSTFQPDFIWIKNRSQADDHMAIDAARGVTKQINPDGSDVEVTDMNGVQAFSDKLWIDASGETLIGSLTSAGGLAAAWDGNSGLKLYGVCAAGDTPGSAGIDWGVGNTKTITRMISIGSKNYGYSNPGRTINIKLEGSTDNFSSSVVDLGGGTGDFTDAAGVNSFKMVTPTSTTAYRYHRFYATSSVGSINLAQCQFFEDNTGDTRGFTLGSGPSGYNDNAENFVAWQWLAGGGAGSANAVGSITTTTTTVNTTAGISIGTYTGTGVAATIGHGLGVVPTMVIVKCRNDGTGAGQGHWYVYHAGNTSAPETDYLYLNEAAATVDNATIWNDTAPTSTVFSIGTGIGVNENTNTYICYAFANIEGFSRFGNYVGNGNVRGAPALVGFKPAWVMIKKTSGTGGWVIYDSQRSPYNEIDDQLFADTTAAETTGSEEIDFTALGFQIRTADSDVNTVDVSYIYAAFAEYPTGGGEDVTPATTF